MDKLQEKFESQIKEMVEASVRLGELGYAASHGGNLCCRIEDDILLITPTKSAKRKMTFEDIVLIDSRGKVLFASPGRRPSGEVYMYLRILEKRPDIKGVIHAHPPVLTGIACTDSNILSRPFLPELVIELGPVLPVDYMEPITVELAEAFDKVIHKADAFLMRNHGVTICNHDGVLRAADMMEMLEAQAGSLIAGTLLGSLNEIPKDEVKNLEKTRKTRNLRIPGDPRYIKSLLQLFYG